MFWFRTRPGDLAEENDDDRPTLPPPPSLLKLVIEDRCVTLFLTTEWTIVAAIGQAIIARSRMSTHPHTNAEIRRWARQLIRSRYNALQNFGINVEADYVNWGGDPDDLKNCAS